MLALLDTLEMVQRRQMSVLAAEDITLNPPWKPGTRLILDKCARRYSKDIVKLLKCPLFGLWQPQEDHDQGQDVETTGSLVNMARTDSAEMRKTYAKKPKAPVGVKADRIRGNEMDKTAAQNKQVETAQPIPTSRWDSGKTSAE